MSLFVKKFDPTQTLEYYLEHVLSKFTAEIHKSANLYLDVKNQEQDMDNALKAIERVLKYEEKIVHCSVQSIQFNSRLSKIVLT